ncbi:hexose transporter like protein [Zymoseptoria brevis]|uniref:Hexose transporter like protein n=1 Tax=Zymoseptoria brevis TaxID=1047168 RepID=A0A0F4G7A5_9PEZI|nr:hexose transporter like protein [Zymoseptoria brevis]
MEKHDASKPPELDDVSTHYDPEDAIALSCPPVQWWRQNGLRRLYLMLPFLFLGATTNGFDGSLLNGLQTMVPWRDYFNNPTGGNLGLFNAIQNIGGVCALPFSSYLSDLFGRRWAVTIGIIVVLVGTILQVVPAANHEGMFIGGRFMVGLGANLVQGSAPVLIMELAYPQHRGKLTTMYNVLWYLGSIVAAWTVFGTVGYQTNAAWRIPVGVQAVMPVIQLAGLWFIPESPRWLCSKDRGDEARDILVKYHANGDHTNAFVQLEFEEIQTTIQLEKRNAKQGWLVFLKTPGNRKRLLLIALVSFFSQCSGNGLVSYYLHSILDSIGITGSRNQSLINGGLQIWSFLVALGFAFMVDRMGRRKLFLIAGVGMLIAFSVWTACSAVYAQTGNSSAGSAVIAMIFLFYGVAGFAWPGLTIAYCAEILPFNIRAKGMAINFTLISLSSVFNQYVNPIGLEQLHWRFYFVYIAILVIECLCIYFLFVETRGPTLEEIAVLFDGKAAHVRSNEEYVVQSAADEKSRTMYVEENS